MSVYLATTSKQGFISIQPTTCSWEYLSKKRFQIIVARKLAVIESRTALQFQLRCVFTTGRYQERNSSLVSKKSTSKPICTYWLFLGVWVSMIFLDLPTRARLESLGSHSSNKPRYFKCGDFDEMEHDNGYVLIEGEGIKMTTSKWSDTPASCSST